MKTDDLKHPDLFGGETKIPEKPRGWVQQRKRDIAYREQANSEDRTKCCKNCKHRITIKFHNRNYHKCALIGVSRSAATDIRLYHHCRLFQPSENQ